MSGRPSGPALLLGGAALVVVAVVVVALAVVDSPAEERRQRLDEQRVSHLHAIADAVDDHWSEEGALPPDLDALVAWRIAELEVTDPVTEQAYGYRVTGERTYELCATFATDAPEDDTRSRAGYARRGHRVLWQHPAGRHCFELEAEEDAESR